MRALYVIVGNDNYLLNDAVSSIKKNWDQQGETDEKRIHLNTIADWSLLQEEANSYSLFADHLLLDVRLDKKSIEKAGVEILTQYLQHTNPRCLIILQAHAVPAKQLQWLEHIEEAVLVQVTSLTESALKQWVATQLQHRSIRHDQQVPAIIHQYTQGNMLACAQVIEKIALIYDETTLLSVQDIQNQLIDQCEFQLYELADACLSANTGKALHLLKQASHNRTEPTLILWLLTQEIRQLIKLTCLLKEATNLVSACKQLKIWPQRAKLYEMTLSRLSLNQLYQLLHISKQLDECIKTSQSHQLWHGFDNLALSLCLGIGK